MNNQLVNKMQEEYVSILDDCRILTKSELMVNRYGWRTYSGLILGNILSFQQFKRNENFKEINSQLQKNVAVMVNAVADHYGLPTSEEKQQ